MSNQLLIRSQLSFSHDIAVHADMVVRGDTVFAAGGYDLHFIDISNADAPKLLATQTFKGVISGLALKDATLFVSERSEADKANRPARDGAVYALSVEYPAQPKVIQQATWAGQDICALALSGNHLVAAGHGDGLLIFDVSEADGLRVVEKALVGEYVYGVWSNGEHVHVAHHDYDDDKHEWDDFPQHQFLTAGTIKAGRLVADHRIPAGFQIWRMAACDGAIYLFDRDDNLAIFDAAEPMEQRFAGPSGMSPPSALCSAGKRVIAFHPHRKCAVFGPEAGPTDTFASFPEWGGKVTKVFSFFRRADVLVAARDKELTIFDIPAGSVFAEIPRTGG